MISLTALRKIEPQFKNITDKELEEIREAFYALGILIFEDWKDQKFGSNSPIGLLTDKE